MADILKRSILLRNINVSCITEKLAHYKERVSDRLEICRHCQRACPPSPLYPPRRAPALCPRARGISDRPGSRAPAPPPTSPRPPCTGRRSSSFPCLWSPQPRHNSPLRVLLPCHVTAIRHSDELFMDHRFSTATSALRNPLNDRFDNFDFDGLLLSVFADPGMSITGESFLLELW